MFQKHGIPRQNLEIYLKLSQILSNFPSLYNYQLKEAEIRLVMIELYPYWSFMFLLAFFLFVLLLFVFFKSFCCFKLWLIWAFQKSFYNTLQFIILMKAVFQEPFHYSPHMSWKKFISWKGGRAPPTPPLDLPLLKQCYPLIHIIKPNLVTLISVADIENWLQNFINLNLMKFI